MSGTIVAKCMIFSVDNKFKQFYEIEFKILSALDKQIYDVIIGLPDIRKHNLLCTFANQFQTEIAKDTEVGLNKILDLATHSESTFAQVSEVMQSRELEDMQSVGTEIPIESYSNSEEEDDDTQHWDDTWQKSGSKWNNVQDDEIIETIVKNIKSEDLDFKNHAREFLKRWSNIFCRTLSKIPADIEPMNIEVDTAKWECRQNQGAPRMLNAAKEKHLRGFIEESLKYEIIRPSMATHYSHVYLVPKPAKPDGTIPLRTTIDYRMLNACTKPISWPLPNIAQMLQRIGRAKPKYYAKLDMTWGYWQTPISEASKRFTAFITFMGIFEWNRAPMGAQASPSYFHYSISFVILAGLIYTILESYIDDILIYASTEEELWQRLDQVFTRFTQRNIKFNPDKVFISDIEMEFVGHIITKEGISFSSKKTNGVRDIPLPISKGDLKKFLGVANYFRDHIQNHSIIAKPLNDMLPMYVRTHRNQKLNWSEKQKTEFFALRDAVASCPKLYFLNNDWPIYLETDASDYGIGGVLYQVDEHQNKIPIQFVSKSLTGAQLRWSTPEKEMYALYYCVRKLEHLISDRIIVCKTDHKNNVLIRSTGSDKVLRWDLYLQNFQIRKEYIKGSENEISDTFSRLCSVSDKNEYIHPLMEENIETEYLGICQEFDKNTEYIAPVEEEARSLSTEVYKLMSKVHNSIVGHLGVERTIKKLIRLDHKWPTMRADVIKFIKECPCCQKMSYLKVPILTSPYTTASLELMKKISMDCIGPIRESDGYTHILTIIDNFSRYVGLYPIKGPTALEIARSLLVHIGTFGCLSIMQMDNGTEFINQLINELVLLLGTQATAILAYSKEENAIVERCNFEVMRHLRAMIFEINKREAWPYYIPLAQRIINTEVSSVTGVSPNDLVFGGKLELDGGLLMPNDSNQKEKSLSKWSSEMLEVQRKLIVIAQQRQRSKDIRHITKGENIVTEFPVNSFVLVLYPPSVMGNRAPSKLHTHWKGPMRVVENNGQIIHYMI